MALESTLLTKSQLNTISYDEMRQLISNEIGDLEDKSVTDADHLGKYFTSKSLLQKDMLVPGYEIYLEDPFISNLFLLDYD